MIENVPFAKMNGLGNLIVVADMRGRQDRVNAQAAVALNSHDDTRFDQLMAIHDSRLEGVDYYIDILNSDGSSAQACGNGTRCVVMALNNETAKEQFTFETRAGILNATYFDETKICVDMGKPNFDWKSIPLGEEFADTRYIELQIGPIDAPILHSPSVVSIGNPHAVFWVQEDVWNYDLELFGPLLENHPIFPEKANISLAQIVSRDEIISRTWERGAGITQACGSGACAVGVSAARLRRTNRQVTVQLPGGALFIDWRENDHIFMTGPAQWEFAGEFNPQSGVWHRVEDEA